MTVVGTWGVAGVLIGGPGPKDAMVRRMELFTYSWVTRMTGA